MPQLGAASPGSDCRPDRHWPLLRESGMRPGSSKSSSSSELLDAPAALSLSRTASSLSLREPAHSWIVMWVAMTYSSVSGCQRLACGTVP